MADAAPPPPPDHFDTRFLMRDPNGVVSTQVLRTDRPLSTQELANHVTGQGGTFLGYPDAPPPPAPDATPPPAPAAAAPPPTEEPGLYERGKTVLFPDRSFVSQVPSIGGAATGGALGGAAGAMTGPLAPVAIPVGRTIGAGLGGAGGEALEIGAEKLFGLEPAEQGTAWQRIANAGMRSSGFEAVTAPVQYGARLIQGAARPITQAAGELSTVLAQDLPAGTKVVQAADGSFRNINLLLNKPELLEKFAGAPGTQDTLLRAWWQRMAGQEPARIQAAWEGLTGTQQLALAGARRDAMQRVVDTVASGAPFPGVKSGLASGASTAAAWATGHPSIAAVGSLPAAAETVTEAVPWLAGPFLRTPGGAQFIGSTLPRVGGLVAPRIALPAIGEVPVPYIAAGGQALMAQMWPEASTLNVGQ